MNFLVFDFFGVRKCENLWRNLFLSYLSNHLEKASKYYTIRNKGQNIDATFILRLAFVREFIPLAILRCLEEVSFNERVQFRNLNLLN